MSDWIANGGRIEMLLTALPLLPLVGALAIVAVSCTKLANAGRGIALGVLAAAVTCVALMIAGHAAGTSLAAGATVNWIPFPDGPNGLSISTSLPDGAIPLVLFGALAVSAMFVVATVEPRSTRSHVDLPCAGVLLALFAAAMVLFASDFLTLYVFWQFSGLVGAACMLRRDDDGRNAAAARKIILYGLVADVPLLIGFFLIWATFGSIELGTVIDIVARPSRFTPDQTSRLATIGLCLLAGAAGRCWQFPFLDLTSDAVRVRGVFAGRVQQFVVMPIGVALIVRCLPLFVATDGQAIWVAGVGGLSAVLAGLCAATSRHWNHTIFWASVGLFGLMLVGLGAGNAAGVYGALALFVAHQFVAPSLHSIRSETPFVVGLAAVAILVCGLAGPNRILAAVVPGQAVASSGFAPYLLSGSVGLIQLLLAFALVRSFFMQRREVDGTSDDGTGSRLSGLASLAGVVAAVGLVVATMLPMPALRGLLAPSIGASIHAAVSFAELQVDWLMTSVVVLASAVGGIGGWMSPVKRTQPGNGWLDFVAAPARHGFYLDDIWDLFVVQPVRAVAQLGRFCEWFFIDRFLSGLPMRIPKLLIRCAGPLRTGTFSFYALSVLLATGVLLAVVAWPGG